MSLALLISLDLNPSLVFSAPNICLGKLPSGVKGATMYLFKNLSKALLLYASSLPLCATALADLPTP